MNIEYLRKIEHDIDNSKLLSNCITKILFNFICIEIFSLWLVAVA